MFDWYNVALYIKPPLCSCIQSMEDYIHKLGITLVDSAYKGDLSDMEAYYEWNDSRKCIHKMFVDRRKYLTKATRLKFCYFTVLYAAGVANEFNPKS